MEEKLKAFRKLLSYITSLRGGKKKLLQDIGLIDKDKEKLKNIVLTEPTRNVPIIPQYNIVNEKNKEIQKINSDALENIKNDPQLKEEQFNKTQQINNKYIFYLLAKKLANDI